MRPRPTADDAGPAAADSNGGPDHVKRPRLGDAASATPPPPAMRDVLGHGEELPMQAADPESAMPAVVQQVDSFLMALHYNNR